MYVYMCNVCMYVCMYVFACVHIGAHLERDRERLRVCVCGRDRGAHTQPVLVHGPGAPAEAVSPVFTQREGPGLPPLSEHPVPGPATVGCAGELPQIRGPWCSLNKEGFVCRNFRGRSIVHENEKVGYGGVVDSVFPSRAC